MTAAHDKSASLLALLIAVLLTAHVSQDVVYGFEEGDRSDLIAAAILGVWLYVALTFSGRRAGYLLLLLASFLAPVVSLAHMSGAGAGEDLPAGEGLFFVWTLIGIGVTAPVALLVSVEGLWGLRSSVLGFLFWTAIPISLGAALLGYVAYMLR